MKNDAQSDDISANRHNPNTDLEVGDLGKVHFFQKKMKNDFFQPV